MLALTVVYVHSLTGVCPVCICEGWAERDRQEIEGEISIYIRILITTVTQLNVYYIRIHLLNLFVFTLATTHFQREAHV